MTTKEHQELIEKIVNGLKIAEREMLEEKAKTMKMLLYVVMTILFAIFQHIIFYNYIDIGLQYRTKNDLQATGNSCDWE